MNKIPFLCKARGLVRPSMSSSWKPRVPHMRSLMIGYPGSSDTPLDCVVKPNNDIPLALYGLFVHLNELLHVCHARFALACMILFFNLLALPAYAADEVLIFVLDPKVVVENSLAFRSIQQQISERNDSYKKNALSQHDLIQAAYNALESQKSNISQQEYEQRSRKLAEQARDYNKEAHANKARLDKALSKATSKIDQMLDNIMASYVKEIEAKETSKQILIINKLNVVYANNKLDITEKIRNELDLRLPKVQVKFES